MKRKYIDAFELKRIVHNHIFYDEKSQPIFGPLEKTIREQVKRLIDEVQSTIETTIE